MPEETHVPVLLKETVEGLSIKPDGTYVDMTLGRAGHTREILKRLSYKGLLIGIDEDEEAIVKAKELLKDETKHYLLFHRNFGQVAEVLKEAGKDHVDGILMDLGVSSPQFDEAERGFSYRMDGPLDMRMDQSQELSARTIVNTYSLEELARVFREYGEEKYSYPIAKRIVRERTEAPIETTFQLVDIIKRSKPDRELSKKGHPAKQCFQALRIETNKELDVLKETLPIAMDLLNKGGRLAVISFHSGEDRIVKEAMRKLTYRKGNRYDLPDQEEPLHYKMVTRHALTAQEEELNANRRSKSAKLRIIERID